MIRTLAHPKQARGFSLVELMISIVAGLLLISALLAFTVSSVKSNAEFVTATRLTQELRSVIDFASRELRRAGYDQNYLEQISRLAGSTDQSDFSPIFLDDDPDCVIYAYDRDPGNAGVVDEDNGELRAIRIVDVGGVGVIEAATSDATNTDIACDDDTADYSTYPPTCEGAWCALTDNRVLDITNFQITDLSPPVVSASGTAALPLRIREFQLLVQGNLVGNPDVTRSLQSRVRVRADCLRTGLTVANPNACIAVSSS
jgi:type II secretory pathway pseudopilin PulG